MQAEMASGSLLAGRRHRDAGVEACKAATCSSNGDGWGKTGGAGRSRARRDDRGRRLAGRARGRRRLWEMACRFMQVVQFVVHWCRAFRKKSSGLIRSGSGGRLTLF